MGGGGEGGRNGGGGKELIETVLTCEGNISDPELLLKINSLIHHLQDITNCESTEWLVRKIEPWNSVRVTFSIPKEAADRLHQLAQAGDAALRQLGILSVQVEGDQVISLKVAGPNHETTEILLRTEGVAGSSSEGSSHSGVARSVTQALSGVNVLPGFGQQQQQQIHLHHQPHPVPQFRSPSSVGSDGIPVLVGRSPVVHQRPQGQSYAFTGVNPSVMHPRHVQPQPSLQSPAGVMVSGAPLSHPAVVTRPVFPSNPPPPYPNQELRQSINSTPHQIPSVSPVNGQQFIVAQSNSVVSPSPQTHVQHPSQQSNSLAHTITGGYRVAGSQVSVANSASAPNRGQVRTQVSMVKNSPLLVGLLQQPEQSSPLVGTRNKSVANPPQSNSVALSNSISNSIENGPIPNVISSTSSGTTVGSSGTYIGRSKDGLTTHQHIYSGGSVITNSAPPPPLAPPRHHVASSGLHHHTLSGQSSPSSPASRLQASDDHRRIMVASSVNSSRNKSGHLQSVFQPSGIPAIKEDHKEPISTHSSSIHKKESQLLINPNTGLLEPRPNTDSSDSEPEGRTESPSHDDHRSNSIPSDDESNLSAASRKETDHSDSDVSRVSVASIESKKLLCSDRGMSQERDSSPASLWENNMISSSPGEKIKLRLKLGKEQVAQATIVGNANKKVERRELSGIIAAGISSPSMSEPRVPKLHIKLHSSQPVIIKSVEETEASNKKSLKDLSSLRDDKSKRKGGRSKPRNSEVEFESLKSKNLKLKVKDKLSGDEVSSQVLKILESKKNKHESDFEENSFIKFKETSDNRLKVPRMLEVTKHPKVESKLRTRLKKPPMRKVGDLNSVGEITSHKIMETLPPSITKVAAIHTQQPHRNPNSLSPVPFSSISTNIFSGSSISASFSTASATSPSSTYTCSSSGDNLKAELEKRGSEIIPKTDVKVDVEKNSGDILMTKLCLSNSNLKNLMNGDVSHSEKVTINQMRFKRAGSLSSQAEFPSASKLTIKRKNSEETHTLKALKKEGLGTMPTFLNSSVLINKVSPDKSSISGLSGPHRQNEDLSEKLLKKVESIKGPLRTEIAGLKSNSDITIHSVSKNDILGLTKASDFDRRADLAIKTKPEVTKVGRVTCVDVMDRKALEEALKSSRNSSKKNDISFCKSTSSMVDRLRRWNSIDSSNTVPLTTHSQQQTSDSTNLNSTAVKTDSKEPGEDESSEKSPTILSTVIEKVKNEPCVSQQSNTIINVNSDKDCDNSDNIDKTIKSENKEVKSESLVEDSDLKREQQISECSESKRKCGELSCETTKSLLLQTGGKPQCSFDVGDHEQNTSKLNRDGGKISDLGSASLVKAEVDSPEGTPKGDNGNAQGGEDSGIESMDALSEKSPNHSDQSPNRREDKDCEIYSEKCKLKNVPMPSCKVVKPEEKEMPPIMTSSKHDDITDIQSSNSEQNQASNLEMFKNKLNEDDTPLIKDNSSSCGTMCEGLLSDVYVNTLPDNTNIETSKIVHDVHQDNVFNSSITSKRLDNIQKNYQIVKVTEDDKSSETPFSVSPEVCQINLSVPEVTNVNHLKEIACVPHLCSSSSSPLDSLPLEAHRSRVAESPSESVNFKSEAISEESLSSSQDKLSDLKPSDEPSLTDIVRKESSNNPYSSDTPVTSAFCSSSLSITTTSISIASPKSSVVTSSSILSHPSPTLSPMAIGGTTVIDQSSLKDSSPQGTLIPNSKELGIPFCSSFKPSLLALTLSRPPGSGIMTSQIGTSIASTNYDKVATSTGQTRAISGTTTTTVHTTTTTTTTTTNTKIGSTLDTQSNNSTSIVYCHSLSCNNNSLAYCNSFTSTTNTTATMIILAASTNSCSTAMTAAPNSTKVVTLKPGVNQSSNSAINPPVGKTFRLVALPGNNSMTPAASPVKGQLVTLKPVVTSGIPSIAKSFQHVQSIPILKPEEHVPSTLKSPLTTTVISTVDNAAQQQLASESITNEGQLDLDFVGFSNSSESESKSCDGVGKPLGNFPVDKSNKLMIILSPMEEEPTPMRVHPPLYTYGNRERKKELESDAEDKEKEEGKESQNTSISPTTKLSEAEIDADSKEELLKSKTKDKKLNELTIEIPNAENFPDEKRLTRSTRQSARLASPKINSPAGSGELSPRGDKKSPANNSQAMGKPSPLGMVRTSVSPALRITKRRRHESESSNASNMSEEQIEPPPKTARRKVAVLDAKEEGKGKNGRRDTEHERDKEIESSDDESLHEDDSSKKKTSISSLNYEEEEEIRPSSRSGRTSKAAITRTRDRNLTPDTNQGSRDTTPTRRTARQNRIGTTTTTTTTSAAIHSQTNSHDRLPPEDKEIEASKESKDNKSLSASPLPDGDDQMKEALSKENDKKIMEKKGAPSPSGKEGPKPPAKLKNENETETNSGRRKTRSTTNNVNEDAKRRRLSKEK